MRTDDEILARLKEIESDDWMNTQRDDLCPFLSEKAFRTLCKVPDPDLSDWEAKPRDREAIVSQIKDYMDFAMGKATGHRGISAGRSVEHFQAWTWMIDDYGKIDWDSYTNYGAPILRQICELYGIPLPDDEGFKNMAEGQTCFVGCDEGCSS